MVYESRFVGAAGGALFLVTFTLQRRYLAAYRKAVGDVRAIDDADVGLSLLTSLRHMIKIALPKAASREGLMTLLFVLLFALQALLTVARSTFDGMVIQSLLSRRGDRRLGVAKAISMFVASSLAQSVVASCIQHVRHALISSYRATLTAYFHKRFFKKLTFYHATVLDDRIEAADTYITKYCHEFAEHFAELPYYFVMPMFEAITAFYAIVTQVGVKPAAMMSGIVVVGLGVLQQLTPSFGKMHAALLEREEDFRRLHTDVSTNVEQVAMHHGGDFTRGRADRSFKKVKLCLDQLALAKGHFTLLETVVSTAVWDVVGLLISGKLINDSRHKRGGAASTGRASLLSLVVVQRRLIASFHTAVKDFIVNFKEMSHLSEYTEKLSSFDTVLDSIASGEFHRKPDPRFINEYDGYLKLPSKAEYVTMTKGTIMDPNFNLSIMSPAANGMMGDSPNSSFCMQLPSESWLHSSEPDNVEEAPLIEFCDAEVVTPNGVELINKLNLTVVSGENWVITGPNGCGKSSLLRVLAGMWLLRGGKMMINPRVDFIFLPQNPYLLTNATYVDQILFPERVVRLPDGTVSDETRQRVKDAVIKANGRQIVEEVLGGWGSDVIGFEENPDRSFDFSSLSGGQQQKTAIARLFYHATISVENKNFPVAVMDESTSQMDHDAEAHVFRNMKRAHVTLISVTHRQSVIRHHQRSLQLTREANDWSIENL